MFQERLLALYRKHFREPRRERLFLASACFFLTFAIARITVQAGRAGFPLAAGVWIGDTHVHHLVWGILILLGVGYALLTQGGAGDDDRGVRNGRLMASLYGVGAALTLDEFALWLHLEDVYWEKEGRRSIDAVILFGALVSMGLWGGPFLRAVARQTARVARRIEHRSRPDSAQEARRTSGRASLLPPLDSDSRRSATATRSSDPSPSSGQ